MACAASRAGRLRLTTPRKSHLSKVLKTFLLGWRIISRSGVNLQGRQAPGRIQLHLDAPPTAVTNEVGRLVTDNVLVAQLNGNFLRDVGQLIGVLDAEHPAAGNLGKFG